MINLLSNRTESRPAKSLKTKTHIICLLIVAFIYYTAASGQTKEERATILSRTNLAQLKKLQNEQDSEYKEAQKRVDFYCKKYGLKKNYMSKGTLITMIDVKDNIPIYQKFDNENAAETISTNKVQPGGSMNLGLTGKDIDVLVWEGKVCTNNTTEFGNRVSLAQEMEGAFRHR